MIWGLLEKELRQHVLSLLVVGILMLGGLEVVLHNRFLSHAGGSPLASLRYVLWSFVPLACIVLGQTLVAAEYRHLTQLFLEGLPLPRWVMLALKYLLGLLLLLGATAVLLSVAVHRTQGADGLTLRFLCLLTLRSGVLVWFLWSLCFAHGFMGRYRVLFGAAAVATIQMRLVFFGVDIGTFGPSELVGERFAYDRHALLLTELAVTSAYAALWTTIGFVLGLARDSTLATALSRPMSHTEKVWVSFLLFAGILLLGYYQQRSKNVAPVHLPGSRDVVRGAARVSASSARYPSAKTEQEPLERCSVLAADELAAVAEFLRIDQLPPVLIVHRSDLKPGVFEDAKLPHEQGLMVRANLTSKEFRPETLVQWIVRGTLVAKSLGRLELDQNAWVLDGFCHWWPDRNSPAPPESAQRALRALPPDFSADHLRKWSSFCQQSGTGQAQALAAAGVRLFIERHGPDRSRRFLSSVLSVPVSRDARAWLRDRLNPVSTRFHAATGERLESFADALSASVRQAGERLGPGDQP
jgi:hypothetical protein